MRTPFAASKASVALLAAVVLAACSSDPSDADLDADSTTEGLAKRGAVGAAGGGGDVVAPPPKPKPKPPILHGTIPPGAGVLAPPDPPCSGKERFDLRRKTRSCEDLPGAYVQNGTTYVPGNGGHFRVGRLLSGSTAPSILQAKACIFVWEPDSCATPDKAKLLVEPGEELTPRAAACINDPASCGATVTPPSPPRIPHVIPNGTGRCEVCGFATNRSLWVILPQYWHGFKFQLAGQSTTQYVYVDPPADPAQALDETTVVEVPLPEQVEPQDVSLDVAYD